MRHVLLHGHIFKNAGTTLDWSLRRCFGDGFCEHRVDRDMRLEPTRTLACALEDERIVALSSHSLPSPLPALPGLSLHPLYLLRHPIERLRSVYAFERRQDAQTPGARAAKAMGFREYVAWRMRDDVGPTIRNFQTRYLAGQFAYKPGSAVLSTMFDSALDYLKQIGNVGIVELYDESMVRFEAALGPVFPSIDLAHVPQNVSARGESEVATVYEELGSLCGEVIDRNSYDLALYSCARETLQRRLSELPDFADRLAQLRKRNSALFAGFAASQSEPEC